MTEAQPRIEFGEILGHDDYREEFHGKSQPRLCTRAISADGEHVIRRDYSMSRLLLTLV